MAHKKEWKRHEGNRENSIENLKLCEETTSNEYRKKMQEVAIINLGEGVWEIRITIEWGRNLKYVV